MACFPVRKRSTHAAERNCEMTVASAAPCTPMFRTKINTGSRAMLTTAPSSTVIIPMRPGSESLNAAVAAGIMMYEMMRER